MFRGHPDLSISQIVEKEDYWLAPSGSLTEAGKKRATFKCLWAKKCSSYLEKSVILTKSSRRRGAKCILQK